MPKASLDQNFSTQGGYHSQPDCKSGREYHQQMLVGQKAQQRALPRLLPKGSSMHLPQWPKPEWIVAWAQKHSSRGMHALAGAGAGT